MKVARPVIFLGIDHVLCPNDPQGCHELRCLMQGLWSELFHCPAIEVLDQIMKEHAPYVVITGYWLSFLDRPVCEQVFRNTGLGRVADSLHPDAWAAFQDAGQTRCAAIERWFFDYGELRQPYAILDDRESGTGLQSSKHDRRNRVVFCDEGVGLTGDHWMQISAALDRPQTPWEGLSK